MTKSKRYLIDHALALKIPAANHDRESNAWEKVAATLASDWYPTSNYPRIFSQSQLFTIISSIRCLLKGVASSYIILAFHPPWTTVRQARIRVKSSLWLFHKCFCRIHCNIFHSWSLQCHLSSGDYPTGLNMYWCSLCRNLYSLLSAVERETEQDVRCEKLIDAFHFVKLQRETFNWPLFEENVSPSIHHL